MDISIAIYSILASSIDISMISYWIVISLIAISLIPGYIATRHNIGQYGRHDSKPTSEGIRIGTRAGWIIMELPALAVFIATYLTGRYALNSVSVFLFAFWVTHYAHRSLIYPLQIRPRKESSMKLSLIAQGLVFCGCNGFVNAMWISHIHEYGKDWIFGGRFIFGAVLFIFGFYLNKSYDNQLIQLRKRSGSYATSDVGLFKYVVCPNYFGEILTWVGFSLAAWSLPSLLFLMMTIVNLVPRARKHLDWYRAKFPDYARNRKAVLPFIL